jgi:hypothetical protein
LFDLAKEGNGTFHFIPSSILLGTNFVNSVANVLSNFSQNSILRVTPAQGVKFGGPIEGGHTVSDESWGRQIFLGPLQIDQERDVVIPLSGVMPGNSAYMGVSLTYWDSNGIEQTQVFNPINRKAK